MAEYCVDCFIKLHPMLRKSDLIIVNEREQCEGCGKEVKQTVLDITDAGFRKLMRSVKKEVNGNG